MYDVKVKLVGTSPLSQGQHVSVDKLEKESPKEYEKRTWREKMHADDKGEVYIPLTALKNCLSDAAKYLAIPIPGKGKSTYTKHFEAGVTVINHIKLGINKKDVKENWVFVPSNGIRGGAKRVDKCFPKIDKWGGVAEIRVLDETITKAVLLKVFQEAGVFIGLGVFRPRNNGYFGRFTAEFVKEKK